MRGTLENQAPNLRLFTVLDISVGRVELPRSTCPFSLVKSRKKKIEAGG